MKNIRFNIAQKDIVSLFENSDSRIYTPKDLDMLLNVNRDFWRLAKSLSTKSFTELLLTKTRLTKHEFQFPSQKIVRYSWDDISVFELALSIKKNSYLTHYTASSLHGLTEQIPKVIYVNFEQPQNNRHKVELIQENIDKAFSKAQRQSQNIAIFNDYRICLLNGKFTSGLGVTKLSQEEKISVTNLERTLIDITVRPSYSGGVFEVLGAYRRVKGAVSVNKLTAMLKKLEYLYPYHQSIGFYLEKAGVYTESQIKLLKQFDVRYDFYLAHQMKETEYSTEWRVYYPKGL